jgi:hypothetical protein
MALMDKIQYFIPIYHTKIIQSFANSNCSINKPKIRLLRTLKARKTPIFLRTSRNTPQAFLFIDFMKSSSDG